MHAIAAPTENRAGSVESVPPAQLEAVRNLIADRFGFWVKDSWLGQLALRVAQRAAERERGDLQRYLEQVQNPAHYGELVSLTETILNGETHFLRTEPHFQALIQYVVPEWRKSPDARLRIASLGCSTGEEPYSIALVLHECLSASELARVEITGLDLNRRVLEAARSGSYSEFQLRELSPERKSRWFSRDGGRWLLCPEMKARVTFLQHNLMLPLPMVGLDVIFCRNVMIYFRSPAVTGCFEDFHTALRPGGYLFLGHAESGFGFPDYFEPMPVPDGVIYRNKPRAFSLNEHSIA